MSYNEKKIKAVILLEMLGKPKEYLIENSNNLLNQIRNEPGVSVKDAKTNEPAPLKENNEIFSTFIEIEIEIENLQSLVVLMFKYMPAHVEIISPLRLEFSNVDLGNVLTDLILRLHSYEEIARIMQSEKQILEKKLRELLFQLNEKGNKEKPSNQIKDKPEINENKTDKDKTKTKNQRIKKINKRNLRKNNQI